MFEKIRPFILHNGGTSPYRDFWPAYARHAATAAANGGAAINITSYAIVAAPIARPLTRHRHRAAKYALPCQRRRHGISFNI